MASRNGTEPRVLIVSQHPYPEDTTLQRNVGALLSSGVAVDLVCVTWGPRKPPPHVRLHAICIEHKRSHAWWYPLHFIAFFAWAFFMVSLLAVRNRYQAVEVDNLPDFLAFTTIVPRLRRTRIVLYLRELMPELTMARLRRDRGSAVVRLARWLERAATGWSDRVVTVSNTCRRLVEQRSVNPRKITVVPNSHPLASFPPRRPAQPPFIVLQTTLIERYGVDVAIRALAQLHPTWPDLTLEIIGDGEQRQQLIELADRLGLSQHVRFSPGWLVWSRAMQTVSGATLGIVPIVADGYGELMLPNKILEFAMLEIPAAASRLPGLQEHFPEDAVAYFEPGDAAGLAAQLHRLLADPQAARRQALRARQAAAPLAWESALPRYLEALGLEPYPAARVASGATSASPPAQTPGR